MVKYRIGFKSKPILKYALGFENAYPKLDSTAMELALYKEQAAKYGNLAETFDFPDAMNETNHMLNDLSNDLIVIKDVWDLSSLCELQFAKWRETLWNDIKTDLMEDGAKVFVKDVKVKFPYLNYSQWLL